MRKNDINKCNPTISTAIAEKYALRPPATNSFFQITFFLFRRGDNCFPSPFFPQTQCILSGNRFSFSEEGTTAFRVRFLRKRNAFFRVTAFLFRRGDNCFPSPFSPLRASPFSENSVYPLRICHNNNLSYALSP